MAVTVVVGECGYPQGWGIPPRMGEAGLPDLPDCLKKQCVYQSPLNKDMCVTCPIMSKDMRVLKKTTIKKQKHLKKYGREGRKKNVR